jgi:hypothetical protein
MSPVLETFANASLRGFRAGGALAPGSYDLITTIAGSGTNSITFSSIPNTYKHLQIRIIGRSSAGTPSIGLRVNGDSGNNYAWHRMQTDGSSITANDRATSTSYGFLGFMNPSLSANGYTPFIVELPDYLSAKNRTIRSMQGIQNANCGISGCLYMSTTAVSSITIFDAASGNFTTASRFSLYGIRG